MHKEAIVILGHGSIRPEGQAVIYKTADNYRAKHPNKCVRYAFIEVASPSLEEAIAELISEGKEKITVMPLFLSFGHHIKEELPKRMAKIAAENVNVQLITTEPIGADPILCDIIDARLAATV